MKRKYYFAYGSNMDETQMKKRCPHSKLVGVAILKGYRFVYDGYSSYRQGAVANLIKDQCEKVFGVLYEISETDEENLDRYEGYPVAYDKKEVEVEDLKRRKYKALVYLREPRTIGKPSRKYEMTIITTARKFGFPEEYINKFLKVE